ncbi:MAG: response regulator transcription factor [Propionibacteriaceae bacterium]|nr:response regulator transcription factor [Propionibacteriaceae bacterium]
MPVSDRISEPLRVLLVDDHEIVRVGLAAMLSRFPDQVEVVGSAGELDEAVQAVQKLAPEIVLCDMRLRSSSGLDVCAAILRVAPVVKVVFMTVYDDEQYLYQALRAGASGYLTKRTDGPELIRHLENVRAGEVVIDPSLAGRVATVAAHLTSGEFWPGARLGLTQRESEVLALLVAGLSNKAIATRLVVSDDTVKTHLRGLYRKLEVNDRAAAVAAALREGLFH